MNQLNTHQTLPGIPFSNVEVSFKAKIANAIKRRALELMNFAKYSYLAMVMILLMIAVVELKHIFQIDIFPGIDTPIDNAYYAGKSNLENGVL